MKKQSLLTLSLILAAPLFANAEDPAKTQTGTTEKKAETTPTSSKKQASPEKKMDVKELKIVDVKVGQGAEAVPMKTVTVHYTGRLLNGVQFDSSIGRGPFQFVLGAGRVIQGWDKGVAGMKVGGKRKLTIPSSMGYGSQGAGNVIPPNAGLEFEVELLGVQ